MGLSLLSLVTLSLYVLFVGFTFCDGFKLHILKKLIWFSVFLLVAIPTFKSKGTFDLAVILPVPTLLAFMLCWYEKKWRGMNMLKITKEKRAKEVIILGWGVLSFAVYIFYKSVIILEEYLIMPFSFMDILTKGALEFKINFLNVVLSHIFSILLFIAGVKILYLKKWAFILLISVFILDFLKRFYLMITLAGRINILFKTEAILMLLAFYCLCRSKIRLTLK